MRLYMQLHDNPMPEDTAEIAELWNRIVDDKNHHYSSRGGRQNSFVLRMRDYSKSYS